MTSPTRTLHGLYAITDPVLLPGNKLFDGVEAALKGGASIIQYRNKYASNTERQEEASTLKEIVDAFGALFLINDDLSLCQRVGADGVHLGKSDGDIAEARTILGPEKILGVTCHSDIRYARESSILGANYCAFGRLYPSQTKPGAPKCALEILTEALQDSYQSVAIGGINHKNARDIVALGTPMIAVIHALFGQEDIEAAAKSFSSLFI